MIFSDMQRALMEGGHSLEGYTIPKHLQFIRELKEARLIKTKNDLKFSYSEVCEHLYLIILALDFLSRLKQGKPLAKKYAAATASYINYTEFKVNGTDLYNLVYFVTESPSLLKRFLAQLMLKNLEKKPNFLKWS